MKYRAMNTLVVRAWLLVFNGPFSGADVTKSHFYSRYNNFYFGLTTRPRDVYTAR